MFYLDRHQSRWRRVEVVFDQLILSDERNRVSEIPLEEAQDIGIRLQGSKTEKMYNIAPKTSAKPRIKSQLTARSA